MTKLRWVWHDAMKRLVIDRGLPVPAADADLKLLSAEHLEARAVHAARFHDNWCSPQPRPTRRIEFRADKCLPDEVPDSHPTNVNQVLFLPRHSGEFLVTVVGRVITCWEIPLDGSGAYRVAEWVSSKKVDQVVINEDPKHEAILAYLSGELTATGAVEICALALDKFHGRFKIHAKLRGHRNNIHPLHVMHGDYVLFGDPLFAWFCSGPMEAKNIGRFQDAMIGNSDRILTVRIVNRYMLVVRERSFQLDYAPLWKGQRISYSGTKAAIVQVDHPASEAVVVVRNTAVNDADPPDWPSEPVTILTRCMKDGLDTLQQFDLLPKTEADIPADGLDKPLGNFTLPCMIPSTWSSVVIVAPSCRDLCISPSGKGFWVQTRNVTSRHSMHPARCLVGFQITRRIGSSEKKSLEPESRPKGTQALWAKLGNDLQICHDSLYSRRCDMSEIIWKKYSVMSAALEDTVGRIAIGDRTGRVEVLDFA